MNCRATGGRRAGERCGSGNHQGSERRDNPATPAVTLFSPLCAHFPPSRFPDSYQSTPAQLQKTNQGPPRTATPDPVTSLLVSPRTTGADQNSADVVDRRAEQQGGGIERLGNGHASG